MTYSSFTAGRLGLSVGAVMGLDEEAATAAELASLEELGVTIERVALRSGPVFENTESARGRTQVALRASEAVPPQFIPPAWRSACAFLFNPVAGELDDAWAETPSAEALVALDCQGMMRSITPGRPVEPKPLVPGRLLQRADLIAISEEDARGGGELALMGLLSREDQEVVIKVGQRGGLRVRRRGARLAMRAIPIVPSRRTVDRTGAGDAFLAGWLCGRLILDGRRGANSGSVSATRDARPLHLASLVASLSVERTPAAVATLRQRVSELTTGSPVPAA